MTILSSSSTLNTYLKHCNAVMNEVYCAICMDQSFMITTDVIAVYVVLFIRNSDKYIIISYLLLISCTYNKISFQKLDLALISVLSIRAPTFSSFVLLFSRVEIEIR